MGIIKGCLFYLLQHYGILSVFIRNCLKVAILMSRHNKHFRDKIRKISLNPESAKQNL